MGDYIGGKPRRKGRGTINFIIALILIVSAGATYLYFDYIWPKQVQRGVIKHLTRVEEMINRGCADDDASCQERISKAQSELRDNPFELTLKEALSSPEMVKRLKQAHTDGSISFLVALDDQKQPSPEELVLWLENYGSQKFLDDRPLIARMRDVYEGRYLKPTPALYQYKLLRKLRWSHIPFGKTWRDYTLASRYLGWSALLDGPKRSSKMSKDETRVMDAMKKKPLYFTEGMIEQLTYLAKKELTLERLTKLRDSLKRFVRDVRELPLSEDKTRIELGWLASREDMHPWLKRRWGGPYVSASELVDLWGCAIVGVRVPHTGEMTFISYGSDCQAGGENESEDIAYAVTSYTPRPAVKAENKPVEKKKLRRKKKRRTSVILP